MLKMIDRLTGEMSFPNRLISVDKVSYWFLGCRLLTPSRSHNPQERAIPILGLCHGVFTDRFIFRCMLENFFPLRGLLVSQEGCREGKIKARGGRWEGERETPAFFLFPHHASQVFFTYCCFIEIHLIARLSLDPIDRSPFGHLVKFTQRSFLLY